MADFSEKRFFDVEKAKKKGTLGFKTECMTKNTQKTKVS